MKTVLSSVHASLAQFRLRLQITRWLSLAVALFTFGWICYLSTASLIQTTWFGCLFFSLIVAGWIFLSSQLILYIIFLRPHIKNKSVAFFKTYLASRLLKKARHLLIMFSLVTPLLIFTFFVLLTDQTKNHFSMEDFFFSIIGFTLGFSITFLLTEILIQCVLGRTLHCKISYRTSLQTSQMPHQISTSSMGHDDWASDPMNPASAEYQSTYRTWNNQDD